LSTDTAPRRERWARFTPFGDHLMFLVPEIADDLDEQDRGWDTLAKEVAKLKGILVGVLISTTTGALLLAVNLIAGGGR
jgi:hypothetical protein